MFIRNASGEYEGLLTWAELEVLFRALGMAPLVPSQVAILLQRHNRASAFEFRGNAAGQDTSKNIDSRNQSISDGKSALLDSNASKPVPKLTKSRSKALLSGGKASENARGLSFGDLCTVLADREFRAQHNLTYNVRTASENMSALLSALSLLVDGKIRMEEVMDVRKAFDYVAITTMGAEREKRNASNKPATRREEFEAEGHPSLRVPKHPLHVVAFLDRCGRMLAPSEAVHVLKNVKPPVGSALTMLPESQTEAVGSPASVRGKSGEKKESAEAAGKHRERVMRSSNDIRMDLYVHPDTLSLDEAFSIFLEAPKRNTARSLSPSILRKEASMTGAPMPTKSGVQLAKARTSPAQLVPRLSLDHRKLYSLYDETVFKTDRELVMQDRELAFRQGRIEVLREEATAQEKKDKQRRKSEPMQQEDDQDSSTDSEDDDEDSAGPEEEDARASARRENVVSETSSEGSELDFPNPEAMFRKKVERRTLATEDHNRAHARMKTMLAVSKMQVVRSRANRPTTTSGIPKVSPRFHPRDYRTGYQESNPWDSARQMIDDFDADQISIRKSMTFTRPSSVPASARRAGSAASIQPVAAIIPGGAGTNTPRTVTPRISSAQFLSTARHQLRSATDFDRVLGEYESILTHRDEHLRTSARQSHVPSLDLTIAKKAAAHVEEQIQKTTRAEESFRSAAATTTETDNPETSRTFATEVDVGESEDPWSRIPAFANSNGLVPPIRNDLWARATQLFESRMEMPISSPATSSRRPSARKPPAVQMQVPARHVIKGSQSAERLLDTLRRSAVRESNAVMNSRVRQAMKQPVAQLRTTNSQEGTQHHPKPPATRPSSRRPSSSDRFLLTYEPEIPVPALEISARSRIMSARVQGAVR